ncbi:MAG: hypothetical protein JSS49_27420 [Planctomycetes bacterium]|nr:hypothetical protein [Planctomycetota bacterium]
MTRPIHIIRGGAALIRAVIRMEEEERRKQKDGGSAADASSVKECADPATTQTNDEPPGHTRTRQ